MATDYSNPGGTGDRTGLISVTANFTPNGSITNLVDGDFSTNTAGSFDYFNGSVAGLWIQFEFPTPQVIDEAKWYQSNTTTHGTFKWQIEIGGVWTDIGSAFALGGANTQTQTQLNGNILASTKYRLLGVSGIFFNSPWIIEIEFKLEEQGAAGYSVDFDDDGAIMRVSPGTLVTDHTERFTTPGADSYQIPPYELLVIEVWGGGASGAALVNGQPTSEYLGEAGEDSSATIGGITITGKGGKPSTYFFGGNEMFAIHYMHGGEGGGHEATDDAGEGFVGQRGEDGRKQHRRASSFGAKGGDAPLGGQGGQRSSGTTVGYGQYQAVGNPGQQPGGGGGSAGIGGNGGPVIGNDVLWNYALGGGGAGGLRRLVIYYLDEGAPEPGDTITFTVGAGGASPTGDYSGVDLYGGAGGDGEVRIFTGRMPEPPPPNTGQGTVTLVGDLVRVGETLTAVFNDDDPDGAASSILFQWNRNGTPIEFATGEDYLLTPDDVGAMLSVSVSYVDALGYTENINSLSVGPCAPEPRPLDDLLDGLFKAYSTRWLNSSYTGPILRLRAGSTIDNSWGWQQGGTPDVTGQYIRFDFGTPRVVTEALFEQNSYTPTTGQGEFRWQGSNDGSSWTNIGSTFILNAASSGPAVPMTELAGNTAAYRFYQLLGVSGTWANNLVWEAEFKIDDNGEVSRIGAPGGQSYQNPGGEGPRSDMITVTTSFAAGGIQNIVSGRYPDARKSFWPNYNTGELDAQELDDWLNAILPTSFGSTISMLYDQSGNGRHFDNNVGTVGGFPAFWNSTGNFYTVPNGRFAMMSNGNANFKRNGADSPQNCLYFVEVIQRHNERPIIHWDWPYSGTGAAIRFAQPDSSAQDWLEEQAVLLGNGISSANAPRAVTQETFDTTDGDAVLWEGVMNASKIAILRNRTNLPLAVREEGYVNKPGTANFRWPFAESSTDRSVRLCELVFWDVDIADVKPVEMAIYRLNTMLAWLDEMPEPGLTVAFTDDTEMDAEFNAPLMPFEGEVHFVDDAWMSAILTGFESAGLVVDFTDDAIMNATLVLPDPVPHDVQLIVINTGGSGT